MGAFKTQAILDADPSLIPAIAARIASDFEADGYAVQNDALDSGGADLSLAKGGIFKSVLGLKTALKVSLLPRENSIAFEAGIGIFGQQIVPTLAAMFIAWPVLITQIWGLVQQAKLDDRALEIARQVIDESGGVPPTSLTENVGSKFCVCCGTKVPSDAAFCPRCGNKF